MHPDELLPKLERDGIVLIPRGEVRDEEKYLKNLISSLRPRHTEFSTLAPLDQSEARPNTLSAEHGLGEFPAHTDSVTRRVPPRYLILLMRKPRQAKTKLYNLPNITSAIKKEAYRAIFNTSIKHRAFPTHFIVKSIKGHPIYRYNPDIMEPVNEEAAKVASAIKKAEGSPDTVIDWNEYQVAIFDNWKFLHGREPAEADAPPMMRSAIWALDQ